MVMTNCDQASIRTAGLIIIGNEILSGKTQDQNSFFLAAELRSLGVSLIRISVIPDDLEMISREAALFSKAFDLVFTTGGVGPTHDDITMSGIARAFGVQLVRNPVLEKAFHRRYGEAANDAIMKMAEVPEGAEVMEFTTNNFPLVAFRNIYIFPGIPRYLQEKFTLVKERFRTSAFFLKRIYLRANEADIAAILNTVVEKNACVTFGSYPIIGNDDYQIIVTAESKIEADLKSALEELLQKLPGEIIVKVG
ncbi:MAG: competence/damage-inducible protein A [Nitrospirae bacterium]|nr:competence/damage-inducible protein A [Nitrospirota bacterium]